MMVWINSLITVLITLLSPLLIAAESKVEKAVVYANPVGANQLVNVTFGLMIVLSLIFALAWLYHKYGNIKAFNRSDIKILAGVSLGSREKAILLEVEGQRLLVGVAAGHVSTLHTFTSSTQVEDDISELEKIENTNEALDVSFADKLAQQKQAQESVS